MNPHNINELTFQILLDSDIKTLENLCFADKSRMKICNDQKFWENFFQKNNMKIFKYGNNVNEWLKIYTLTEKMYNDVYTIMHAFQPRSYYIDIFFGKTKLNDIPSLKIIMDRLSKYQKNEIYEFEETYYGDIALSMYVYMGFIGVSDKGDKTRPNYHNANFTVSEIYADEEEMKNILLESLYHGMTIKALYEDIYHPEKTIILTSNLQINSNYLPIVKSANKKIHELYVNTIFDKKLTKWEKSESDRWNKILNDKNKLIIPIEERQYINKDMLYNVLLKADIDDLPSLCYIDKMSNQICHDKHYIKNKFEQLPFKIQKSLSYTFKNLMYVNHLIKLATTFKNFILDKKDFAFSVSLENQKKLIFF